MLTLRILSSHLNCTTLLTLGNISYHNVTQVLTFSQSDLAFKLDHYLLASSDTFILITCPLAQNSLFTDPLFSLKRPPSALADYRKKKSNVFVQASPKLHVIFHHDNSTLLLCFKVWFHPGLTVWFDARELADGSNDARAVPRT